MLWNNYKPNRNGIDGVLGTVETEVMKAVWSLGTANVTDVVAHIPGASAYETIKTIMERMTSKGLLERVKSGRSYRYRALVTRDVMEAQVSRSVIEGLLAGFGSTALMQFADIMNDDPAQLAELQSMLKQMAGDNQGAAPGEGDQEVNL